MTIEIRQSSQLSVLPSQPRLGAALLLVAVAQMMVVLDTTIVNVALPSIQRGLGFSPGDLEWVVNAYALTFGGLLLLGGRAGDLLGRRRVLVSGLVLFSLGSLAGGLATSPAFLVFARAAQGVGAALVSPATLALIADTFPEGPARHRAIGVFSGVGVAGGAIGLILGGIITTYASWRFVLFVNVPIGLVLAAVTPRVLPAPRARRGRLDLPGALAATGGAALLVYGLSRAATTGWGDSLTVLTLAAAAALGVVFLVIEAVTREPLVPLGIFADRNRASAYALSLANGATLSGLLFLLILYLQDVRGFSPLEAGLAFLPTTLGVVIGAGSTSRLIGRVGPKVPMVFGSFLAAVGLLWLSQLRADSDYATAILGPLVIFAAGVGQVFVSTGIVALRGIGADRSGLSSALLNVGRQLGGSLGIAIMGTFAANVASQHLASGVASPAAVGRATVLGFASAFGLAAAIAFIASLLALAAVTGFVRTSAADQLQQEEVAA